MNKPSKCGCGRSPTGNCIGWHSLSDSEYKVKKAIYEKRQAEKAKNQTGVYAVWSQIDIFYLGARTDKLCGVGAKHEQYFINSMNTYCKHLIPTNRKMLQESTQRFLK